MFNPRGVAFFGGLTSPNPASFGRLVFFSQVKYGYSGRFYPISSQGGELAGHKIHRSLDEVDGPVDLAVVAVPAEAVPKVLRSCLKNGVAGAQVHSSGFAETGEPEGIRLQEELTAIARQGLRLLGPNCFGLHSPRAGITLIPGFEYSTEPGPLSLFSQSGGVAAEFGYEARRMKVGVSKLASFGNGCDLDAVELMDYLADDPDTGIITAYLESVSDGRRFLDTVRRASRTKPVIIWKAGRTPLGERAARSHTGALAGRTAVWDGALAQAGAVSVQGLDEMTDAVAACHYLKRGGRRVAFMGGGGAIGVFSSDLAGRFGLDVPLFSARTQANLRQYFPTPGNSMANPLDTGSPALPLEVMQALSREVLVNEPVDVLVVILLLRTLEVEIPVYMSMNGYDAPPSGAYLEGLAETLAATREETGKDVVLVVDKRAYLEEEAWTEGVFRRAAAKFHRGGIPVYTSTERALRGIRAAALAAENAAA